MKLGRYFRLLTAFARFSLAQEMAFRGNFLINVFVELLWLSFLLIFYKAVFAQTKLIAGWSEMEYLFFIGVYFAIEGVIETFFLGNCSEFGEMVRDGSLDIALLKPIDEQFLVSCRSVSWSSTPNIVLGGVVMGIALFHLPVQIHALDVVLFLTTFMCGVLMAYSFLLLLTSFSVWMTRNQNLHELWWLVMSLMRYPREIYAGGWAGAMGWFFTFMVPVLLVVNVPARTMVQAIEGNFVIHAVVATVILLGFSRWFFRFSLRRYRSASS